MWLSRIAVTCYDDQMYTYFHTKLFTYLHSKLFTAGWMVLSYHFTTDKT
jgi:hypothetical protein